MSVGTSLDCDARGCLERIAYMEVPGQFGAWQAAEFQRRAEAHFRDQKWKRGPNDNWFCPNHSAKKEIV